ncbi:hypothetical protein [Phytomonospora endophytica]|uniref:Gram-positive cocci surface proteins LPxTG domain-containing protein n=1 Tax=Phytomonospora endophytica TaxID=714109 RepID=A0A841FFW1_9ACTN|nr:hypothetical protein [Phytomonospora endophytica]MBB6032442.1 hypothetical protein [Phytomonospora endophytica]GIG66411.1 hypothetical protein Pen01_27060 [Phytomonospora endophytica]
MKKPTPLLLRTGAPLVLALALMAGALLAFGSPPAQAAPLGTIVLSPTTGSVGADTPTTAMVDSATASAACPTGYGDQVGFRARPVGQATPGNAFGSILSAGGYDTTAPKFVPGTNLRFSLARVLSGNVTPVPVPAPGDYELYMNCFSGTTGEHADRFSLIITVTGSTWAVKTTQPSDSASPSTSASPSDSASPSPSASTSVSTSPTTGGPSPSPSKPGGLAKTGAPVFGITAAGMGLLVAGFAILRGVRRRRTAGGA